MINISIRKATNNMIQIHYTKIMPIGTTQYYDQTEEDYRTLGTTMLNVLGRMLERQNEFTKTRHWKKYVDLLGSEVKYAQGQYLWNPSVFCLTSQLMSQFYTPMGSNTAARFSVPQVNNYNTTIARIVAIRTRLLSATGSNIKPARTFQIQMVPAAPKTNDQFDKLFKKEDKNNDGK